MSRILNKYKAYILGVYAFFILLHFVIKDYLFPLSIVYYATPLILIILLGLFITILYYKQKRVLIPSALVLILLIFQFFNSNYIVPKTITNLAKSNSVLFWNIAKNEKGFPVDIISEKIKEFPVNILAFVETENVSETDLKALNRKFGSYTFNKLNGNMIIAVKGEIESVIFQSKEKSYKSNYITTIINNKTIKILIVDVYASPFQDKSEALATILNFSKTNEIDFIIGDFNTPYQSIHFNNYKNNFTSFRNYSEGFTATWPFGIPLLELDQIWINNSILGSKLNKYNYKFSDHQLLIAEYYFNEDE